LFSVANTEQETFGMQTDYREILRQELVKRQEKNPAYSLRAFARDLKVSPSRLSEVMRGAQLSSGLARTITRTTGWSESERRRFVVLVEAQGADKKIAARARARLKQMDKETAPTPLDLSKFRVIGEWQYTAILAYLTTLGGKITASGIATDLGIDIKQVEEALRRLIEIGLVAQTARGYKRTAERLTFSSPVPSSYIRSYHEQLIHKSLRAIHEQSAADRHLQSLVFAIRKDRVPEAFRKLEEFVREFNQEFAGDDGKDLVVALTAQMSTLGQRSNG
jgi:uncharacterized protein (TIGR02147 family)